MEAIEEEEKESEAIMSVFAGVKFFLSNRLSMEDHRNLRKIIADQGGQIVEQPGDSKCFHVLPLFTQPDAEVPSAPLFLVF